MYDDHHILRGAGDQNWTEAAPQSGIQQRAATISAGIPCECRGLHAATARLDKPSERLEHRMKDGRKDTGWLVERVTRVEKRSETAPCTPGLCF